MSLSDALQGWICYMFSLLVFFVALSRWTKANGKQTSPTLSKVIAACIPCVVVCSSGLLQLVQKIAGVASESITSIVIILITAITLLIYALAIVEFKQRYKQNCMDQNFLYAAVANVLILIILWMPHYVIQLIPTALLTPWLRTQITQYLELLHWVLFAFSQRDVFPVRLWRKRFSSIVDQNETSLFTVESEAKHKTTYSTIVIPSPALTMPTPITAVSQDGGVIELNPLTITPTRTSLSSNSQLLTVNPTASMDTDCTLSSSDIYDHERSPFECSLTLLGFSYFPALSVKRLSNEPTIPVSPCQNAVVTHIRWRSYVHLLCMRMK